MKKNKSEIIVSSQAPNKELQKITDDIHNLSEHNMLLNEIASSDPSQKMMEDSISKEMDAIRVSKADLSMFGVDINTLNESSSEIKNVKKQISDINDKAIFSALDLFNLNIKKVPKLVEPFFQKTGLASLVGTSDTGKSTFLRQLALSIALKKDDFLGFKIKAQHNKVIYVSTEDSPFSVSSSIRKQVKNICNKEDDISLIQNLKFIFDSENLYKSLEDSLSETPVDLIIIDAFTDVFTGEINANTQVRKFLNKYDTLAKKNDCLIVFLHHTGKKTQYNKPSKDSIIGSQAFEAKMRAVIEIRNNLKIKNQKELWVLKANFLEKKEKVKSHVLNFDDNLVFSNTGQRSYISENKSNNNKIKNKIIELREKGYSFRKIENELKDTEFQISKSVAQKIYKEYELSKKGGK
ncbi:AAA family ATPase [Tenacibaculum sp. 47A_GOM-205m]|uniref:AAA family ATPase n=1 Tax=Tenacibaculum sp. 47A_GOM-205m TaxID=1380384 RepID=UPI000490C3F9|nr:AAA family ATPase [Tenacibaculum sp. 47A_GOM-205m]